MTSPPGCSSPLTVTRPESDFKTRRSHGIQDHSRLRLFEGPALDVCT